MRANAEQSWRAQLRPREVQLGGAVVLLFLLLLTPIVHNELQRDAGEQARLTVRHLAGAIPPVADLPPADQVVLAGDGRVPRVAGQPAARSLGSALQPPRRIDQDPWGNAYLVLRFDPSSPEDLWVLSAGPDGELQTRGESQEPSGDDVGLRVRLPVSRRRE